MITVLKTVEEARKYRYGDWAGNPKGYKYVEGNCAYEACTHDRSSMFYQCTRKNGYGPGELYCKQHAKKVEPEKYPQKPVKKGLVERLFDANEILRKENEELKNRIAELEDKEKT